MPNYHLKTTHFTFGGSIFSGTELKANTKMETDVKRAGSSTLLHVCSVFSPISLCLSLGCPLLWPNVTPETSWRGAGKIGINHGGQSGNPDSDSLISSNSSAPKTCGLETPRVVAAKGRRRRFE